MSERQEDDAVRVGNPERERAIGLINDSFSNGYLDVTEFEERSGVIYAARIRAELRTAVEDLPNAHLLFPAASTAARMSAPAAVAPPEVLDAGWDTVKRKGSWRVPAAMTLTGDMGTFDLDFRRALFTAPTVDLQIQVSASTIKLRVAPGQEVRHSDVVTSGWSSVKDKAGPASAPTGPVIVVTGSLAAMSSLTVKRS